MTNHEYPQHWTPDVQQTPDTATTVRTARGEPITLNPDHTITTPTVNAATDYPTDWGYDRPARPGG